MGIKERERRVEVFFFGLRFKTLPTREFLVHHGDQRWIA
jgi:hypothetical protein